MPSPLAEPLPWDLVSDAYASEVAPLFAGYARVALELAQLTSSSRVADVACGPGTATLLAASRVAHVAALDFAPAMIAQLAARDVANVHAQVGDGQALPWADASFDAALSLFGLMFFPDRARGFRELRRVLVPGGRAVVSSWYPPSAVPQLVAMYAAVMPPGSAPTTPPEIPLKAAEDYAHEMGAAGFVDVAVTTHVETLAQPSMSALWESFARTNAPMVLMRHRLGEDAWARAADAARAKLVAAYGDGPQRIEMPAWIAVASRPTP